MADGFTFFVYLASLFLSVGLVRIGSYQDRPIFSIAGVSVISWGGLMLIVLVSGLRDGVGTDFDGYSQMYYEQPFFDESTGYTMEWGYMMTVKVLSHLGLKAWSFFLLYALITYGAVLLSFKRFQRLSYLGIFYFISFGFFFFTLNGVRQGVAMAVLGLAVGYIIDRKWWFFLAAIIFGGLIHKSLFLFLPLYLILERIRIPMKVWYGLFAISIVMRVLPVSEFLRLDQMTMLLSGTQVDYSSFQVDQLENNEGITLGYIVRVLVGLFIFSFYNKLIRVNESYSPYMAMAMIGILLYNAFPHIHFISRLTVYFAYFNVFALSFITDYLIRNKRYILINMVMAFFILLFSYGIYVGESGTSPYRSIDLGTLTLFGKN